MCLTVTLKSLRIWRRSYVARMIPPHVPADCRSPGEKLLFSRFRDDPDTANWIVLHSLGVAKHPKRIEGEVDFVVLVPGEGILCLEVKAGQVARRQGVWIYGTSPFAESSTVGPFRQAADGMYGIRNFVAAGAPDLKGLLFFSAVIFTYIDFDEESTEWHSWQFADRSQLARQPISSACVRILRRAHNYIRTTPSAKWYDIKRSRPDDGQIKRIADLLRGDFEFFASPQARADETEKQIRSFTEEQFGALDLWIENARIIYKGPAGTGKTILAIESARRSVHSGKATLFGCYNRLLGEWLIRQTEKLTKDAAARFSVGTFHSILLRLSGLTVPSDGGHEFWTHLLPERVLERTLNGELDVPMFDVMVLDEAQDLLSDVYLDVIEMLLAGGLAGGRWALFGDFERQAIYASYASSSGQGVMNSILERAPHHTIYPLRINCRNAENIAISLELACRLDPGYTRILNTDSGSEVVVDFYRNQQEQMQKLSRLIEIVRQTFRDEQTVILSMKEDSASCANLLSTSASATGIHPFRDGGARESSIGFATIHAFKGLEAPAVILTDIDEFGGDRMESLLYIGMSRARQCLAILMHESCRTAYEQGLRDGFKIAGRRRRNDGRS